MASHWILENIDIDALKSMTDDDLMAWAKDACEPGREMAIYDLDDSEGNVEFPRFGYTTAQVFEDWDSYRAFKIEDINEETEAKVDETFAALVNARDAS